MRVAVVGAGIAGLVSAFLLHDEHDVTVFEANDYAGGHTHTVTATCGDRAWEVDTGFIVFNEHNYPSFTRLLDRLGVETQASDMSFSVRCDRSGLEYNATSVNRLFAQRRNLVRPAFLGMVRDILRFHREAPAALADGTGDERSVGQWLEEHRYGKAFAEWFLVPMGSALWSCPRRRFRSFPVRFVLEFFHHHRMLQASGRPEWRVVRGGSHRYVERLVEGFRRGLRLECPVRSVRRDANGVRVASAVGEETFDHVVLACHGDQALALLSDPSATEHELLGAFPYQRNEAVLHTDTSVLPRRRRAWASWNYHVPAEDPDQATVTYNMSCLQGLDAPETFCVTLNGDGGIDPARVIRRMTYDHPVYTERRAAAQGRHHELIDVNRTSFCGAYWGYGFHEDGVRSALAVAGAFGRSL